jgi:hypothetical protein
MRCPARHDQQGRSLAQDPREVETLWQFSLIAECLHSGKPTIVLPLLWDQYDNAQRMQELAWASALILTGSPTRRFATRLVGYSATLAARTAGLASAVVGS